MRNLRFYEKESAEKKASVCVWGWVEDCSHELLKGLGERGLRQGQAAGREEGPAARLDMARSGFRT